MALLSCAPEPGSPCHESSHGAGLGLAEPTGASQELAQTRYPQHPPLGCPRILAPLAAVPGASSTRLQQDPGIPSPKAGAGSSTLYPHRWRPFPTRKGQSRSGSLSGD